MSPKKVVTIKQAARRFTSITHYLSWLMNSNAAVGRHHIANVNQHKDLICQVLSKVLYEACIDNPNIEKFYDMEFCLPVRRSMLSKIAEDEFHFRLLLRRPGVRNSLEMVIGQYNDVPKGNAVLRLDDSLILEDRNALIRLLNQSLDGNCISSEKMVNLTIPTLIKALKAVNAKDIDGHHIRTIIMQSDDGLSVIFSSRPTDNKLAKTESIKIHFDIGMLVTCLPSNFELHSLTSAGRDAFSCIKFKLEDFEVCVYVPTVQKEPLPKWYRDGSLLNMSHRARARKVQTISELASSAVRSHTTLTTVSPAVISGKRPAEDTFWKIDFDSMERSMIANLKTQPGYHVLKDVFSLYNILTLYGKKVLPPLNEKTKQALFLWLFKEISKKGGSGGDMSFIAVLQLMLNFVKGCFSYKYCPSFTQPHINTMVTVDTNQTEEALHTEKGSPGKAGEKHGANTDEAHFESISKLLEIIENENVLNAMKYTNIY